MDFDFDDGESDSGPDLFDGGQATNGLVENRPMMNGSSHKTADSTDNATRSDNISKDSFFSFDFDDTNNVDIFEATPITPATPVTPNVDMIEKRPEMNGTLLHAPNVMPPSDLKKVSSETSDAMEEIDLQVKSLFLLPKLYIYIVCFRQYYIII